VENRAAHAGQATTTVNIARSLLIAADLAA
jgi:hypothetical protein